ncbi:MAG TPA: hypothetical protein VI895_07410 [Bdellovibrionota bacterium]|nr:hypothetical protein [Bdellovibrionota bacterium]
METMKEFTHGRPVGHGLVDQMLQLKLGARRSFPENFVHFSRGWSARRRFSGGQDPLQAVFHFQSPNDTFASPIVVAFADCLSIHPDSRSNNVDMIVRCIPVTDGDELGFRKPHPMKILFCDISPLIVAQGFSRWKRQAGVIHGTFQLRIELSRFIEFVRQLLCVCSQHVGSHDLGAVFGEHIFEDTAEAPPLDLLGNHAFSAPRNRRPTFFTSS